MRAARHRHSARTMAPWPHIFLVDGKFTQLTAFDLYNPSSSNDDDAPRYLLIFSEIGYLRRTVVEETVLI
jgi:hypothetical protein